MKNSSLYKAFLGINSTVTLSENVGLGCQHSIQVHETSLRSGEPGFVGSYFFGGKDRESTEEVR